MVTGIGRNEVTTTNDWQTKARYDRFFTANNAGYAAGQAAADRIAGKSFAGGGQVGYSRQLYQERRPPVRQRARLRLLARTLRAPSPAGRSIRSASIPRALFVGETMKIRRPAAPPPASRPSST